MHAGHAWTPLSLSHQTFCDWGLPVVMRCLIGHVAVLSGPEQVHSLMLWLHSGVAAHLLPCLAWDAGHTGRTLQLPSLAPL